MSYFHFRIALSSLNSRHLHCSINFACPLCLCAQFLHVTHKRTYTPATPFIIKNISKRQVMPTHMLCDLQQPPPLLTTVATLRSSPSAICSFTALPTTRSLFLLSSAQSLWQVAASHMLVYVRISNLILQAHPSPPPSTAKHCCLSNFLGCLIRESKICVALIVVIYNSLLVF